MSNNIILLIVIPLALITTCAAIAAMLPSRRTRLTREYVVAALSLLGWQISAILYFCATSPERVLFVYTLEIPFIAFTTTGMFLFVLKYYGIQVRQYKDMLAALYVIPCMTLFFAITNGIHPFLYDKIEILSIAPVHISRAVRGVWFWMHTVYCYTLIIIACVVVAVKYSQLPPGYKKPSSPLVIAMAVSLIGNYFVLQGSPAHPLDLSLIGGTGCILILFVANKENRGLDFLMYARKTVFDNIGKGVLITDECHIVVNANEYARQILLRVGISKSEGMSLSDIIDIFSQRNINQIDLNKAGTEWEYCFENEPEGRLDYYIREQSIQTNQGKIIGYLYMANEVTENRAIIRKLEEIAGMDALTGISNRRVIDDAIEKLDQQHELCPIAIFSGDMNNLKYINDTKGHQQGDILLCTAAMAIVSICPPSAYVGRIGGDEFMIVMPQCTENQAQDLLREILEKLEKFSTPDIPLHMAWGWAVKNDETESLEDIVQMADQRMYEEKALWHRTHEAYRLRQT